MSAIITTKLRIFNMETFKERLLGYPCYIYIGKDTPWPDEQMPIVPNDSDKERNETNEAILGLKRILNSSVSSVIPRNDWQTGFVYDEYRYDINMLTSRRQSGSRLQFYVLTDEFNVYKCISNNNGAKSTVKPTSTQVNSITTSDGYVWKYMYTLRSNDVFSYMTDSWMPVYTLKENDGSAQWQTQVSAVDGSLSKINITSPGIGYSVSNPPTITITGDGSGAAASVVVDPSSGAITAINITNFGAGYTKATVSITSSAGGIGAAFQAVLSPKGGHGKDAILELGGHHLMIQTTLSGSTDTDIPTTSFRQVGIIHAPTSNDKGSILKISDSFGIKVGDSVLGNTSNATGTVRMVSYDGESVYVEGVIGSFSQNEIALIADQPYTTTDIQNQVNLPLIAQSASKADMVPYTGDILYVSNRERISRSDTQTEEVRMIVTF